MFYGKFPDEGNNLVDNPNIYNVEGDNKLSPGLQTLTSESVFKIRFFTVQFRYCIFYTRKYFAVLQQSNIMHLMSRFSIIKQIKQIITYYLPIGYFPSLDN